MATYVNIKLAEPLQLLTTTQTFYTVPMGYQVIATAFTFANTDSVNTVGLSLYLCTGNSAPDNSNIIIPNTPIDPGSTVNFDFGHVLNAGDTIKAYASAPGITMHGSGITQLL